jgi:hypothetical protein
MTQPLRTLPIMTIRSALTRRAMNVRTSWLGWSSHCMSSATSSSGCSAAASASRFKAASDKERLGRLLVVRAEGRGQRTSLRRGQDRCGSQHGPEQLVQAAERQLRLGLDPDGEKNLDGRGETTFSAQSATTRARLPDLAMR